jgi:hypothetical protein
VVRVDPTVRVDLEGAIVRGAGGKECIVLIEHLAAQYAVPVAGDPPFIPPGLVLKVDAHRQPQVSVSHPRKLHTQRAGVKIGDKWDPAQRRSCSGHWAPVRAYYDSNTYTIKGPLFTISRKPLDRKCKKGAEHQPEDGNKRLPGDAGDGVSRYLGDCILEIEETDCKRDKRGRIFQSTRTRQARRSRTKKKEIENKQGKSRQEGRVLACERQQSKTESPAWTDSFAEVPRRR